MTMMKRARTEIAENGRKVLMAGLGAAVIAGESCSDAFQTLVAKGQKTRDRQKGHGPVEKIKQRAEAFSAKWQSGWRRGLNGSLNRLGLPSRDEIRRLTHSVEQLTERIESLAGEQA